MKSQISNFKFQISDFKLAILMLAAAALCGCSGGSINTDAIGDMFGGTTGSLIKAGGHVAKAASLSEKDEPAMGQSVGIVLTSTDGVYTDDTMLNYVTMVGLTVASSTPNPGGNYVFGILDTDEVNAYSGPDGYIFITRGALQQMKDEAELAGVLAHEIAHVCHHDGLHQAKAAELQAAAANGVDAAAQKNNTVANLSAGINFGIDAITKTGYTQPQEFDADADGVKYMTAAGYDPHSYLNFLTRLWQLHKASAGIKIMSTHPGIDQRVAKVTAEISDMGNPGGATLPDRFATNVVFAKQ